MKKVMLKNQNGKVLLKNVLMTESFFERSVGLMLKKEIPSEADGLLIRPCNSVHTFFMHFPLKIIFLNSKNKVIKIVNKMPPWRISAIYFRASQVLEISSETSIEISVGDTLEVVCIN